MTIDDLGLIGDTTGSFGDSCSFTCTAIQLGMYDDKEVVRYNAIQDFWNGGLPVRHPKQRPWNNSKNFSRDQAVPLMWCLYDDQIKTFLQRNRFFFPNTERDWPGSEKKMYPHKFYKDSRIYGSPIPKVVDTTTVPLWSHLDEFMDGQTQIETKLFDHADPMTPDFVGMCHILTGIHYGPMVTLGKIWCEQSIKAHCDRAAKDKTFTDFKQLYFTAKAYNLHQEFAKLHPWSLYYAAHEYFDVRRSMPEMAEAFYKEFKREGIME